MGKKILTFLRLIGIKRKQSAYNNSVRELRGDMKYENGIRSIP